MNIKVLEPRTLSKLATINLHNKNFKNALAYYDSTYRLHSRTNNEFGIAEVELGRGTVLTEQGRFDDAIRSVNQSLALAKKSNARILQIKCYNQLSALWEKRG